MILLQHLIKIIQMMVRMIVAVREVIVTLSIGVLLDGQIDDIVPGVFVSFKYSGLTPGGKPFNPQVSFIQTLARLR